MAGFMLHQLTDNTRPKDNAFASMLNEIRKKCPAVNSLEDLMLQSRELHTDDNHVDYPRNAIHVCATLCNMEQ